MDPKNLATEIKYLAQNGVTFHTEERMQLNLALETLQNDF